jgi:hypothetical protein
MLLFQTFGSTRNLRPHAGIGHQCEEEPMPIPVSFRAEGGDSELRTLAGNALGGHHEIYRGNRPGNAIAACR